MDDASLWSALAPSIVANILSLGACVWLDRRISALEPAIRNRLFARQMRFLARSDMFLGSFLLAFSVVENPKVKLGSELGLPLCWVTGVGSFLGRMLSMFCEVQIAIGVAFVWYRKHAAVPFLLKTMNWMIPFALFFTLLEFTYSRTISYQSTRCNLRGQDTVDVAAAAPMTLCFLTTCLVYGFTVKQAVHSPQSARDGVVTATMMYPLNFLITTFPLLIVNYHTRLGATRFYDVALAAEGMNGFLNTLTYFVQCKYAKASVHGEEASARHRDVSFHVMFDPAGAEVVRVSCYGRTPMVRSEIEIARLSNKLERDSLSSENLEVDPGQFMARDQSPDSKGEDTDAGAQGPFCSSQCMAGWFTPVVVARLLGWICVS
mmetsp:Transcript_64994/g.149111  ORF Transcript_64994/g.149111 Transcript_64994/m.149111 type:complete len:376 (+) Transcript_64994:36-1163(+)